MTGFGMAAQNTAAPTIIKRKKVIAGGGHHGGAWKVAYADFVTAMMAFFMLMWLLNATTEKQRKGIADYFNPTIPVNRISGGGDGAFGGDSVFSQDTIAQSGTGGTADMAARDRQLAGETGSERIDEPEGEGAGEEELREAEQRLLGRGGESMAMQNALRHVVTRVTDEGLVVEVFDIEDAPLFTGNTAHPEPVLHDLARMISEVFALAQNDVAINGHSRNLPIVLIENPVWDISSRRADVMRELMQTAGTSTERMQRVSGYADRKPWTADPMAVRNNRLEIILLRPGKS